MSSENMTETTENTEVTPETSSEGEVATTENSVEGVITNPQTGTLAAPTYTPNYKFKVMNEEKEFDPIFKGLVKDAETEKKIKEFHEKAYGLDVVKADRDQVKEKFKTINTKYENLDKTLSQFSKYLQNDDMGSFFKGLKIPDDMVFRYVAKRLNEMNLPADQQAMVQRQESERQRLYQLEQQNAELMSSHENTQVQARTYELDSTLAKQDVQQLASMYDSRMGKSGAFRDAVIEHGIFIHKLQGIDVPAEQAVQAVMQKLSPLLSGQPQAPQVQNGQAQPTPSNAGQNRQAPPVIPVVSGNGTSPVKSRPRSLKELKEYAKNL